MVLREQMAEDLHAGSPSQAVKTGSWKGNSKANKHSCVCFQRGRIEDVVVSGECRGKQLGKL